MTKFLNLRGLSLDATDPSYGKVKARLYKLKLQFLHLKGHFISAELNSVSSLYTEVIAYEIYGVADMILRGASQTALQVQLLNTDTKLVCVRSSGQVLLTSNTNMLLSASNSISLAGLSSSLHGTFVVKNMLKGYFAIDTNEGSCNDGGPSSIRNINDTIPTTLTFDSESISHFQAALALYDVVHVTVWGYEVPYLSTWSFTNNEAYQYFSSSYISAFSLSILAPSSHTIELHTSGGACKTGAHTKSMKHRERQVALALRNVIGEASSLKITYVNASGRFHNVPAYDNLVNGQHLSLRQWSEPIQWIAGISVSATMLLCLVLVFLWHSVGRVLYSERMELSAYRYCKEVTTTRRESDALAARDLLYLKSIILPHLNFIHVLQLELYFNRKSKIQSAQNVLWPWPGVSLKKYGLHCFVFPVWKMYLKLTKTKLARLQKSFGRPCDVMRYTCPAFTSFCRGNII